MKRVPHLIIAYNVFFIFSNLISNPIFSQCSLNTINGSCYNNAPVLFGPYSKVSGSFQVKVKYYYVVHSGNQWITQAEADLRSKNSLNLLNNTLNKEGIYFVPFDGFCSNSSTGHILNTELTEIEGIRNDVNLNTRLENQNGEALGIEIYSFFQNDVPSGASLFVPGSVLTLSGQINNKIAIETEIMIHEMGHALGLFHTFEKNCDNCSNGNVDCWCTGDLVDDTPQYTGIESSPHFPCDNEPLSRNYMSYSEVSGAGCLHEFTVHQIERMRLHLAQHPFLAKVTIPTIHYPLNSPGTISGDIIVEPGSSLVISSLLEMLPGATIRVKKGATLTINATITAACGKMWKGIIVEGTTLDITQLPQYQGQLFLNPTGKIEHAEVGIDVQDPDPDVSGSGGGIVKTLGGRMENNTIGIRFGAYSRVGIVGGVTKVLSNKSQIAGTVFTVNANYRGNENTSPVHLYMESISGLAVRYAQFKDERTTCFHHAIGINSNDSGLRAYLQCQFLDLSQGIYTDKLTGLSSGLDVSGCIFRRCITGVDANIIGSNLSLDGNNFTINTPQPCDAGFPELVGVNITGVTKSLSFQNNTFTNGDPFEGGQTIIGTHCTALGNDGNTIFKNKYYDIIIGNKASGISGDISDGLNYLCNIHENENAPAENNYLLKGPIRKNQGTLISQSNYAPAGNVFSYSTFRIKNEDPTIVRYPYYGSNDLQDPTQDVASIGIFPESKTFENAVCADAPSPCDLPCDETSLLSAKNSFFQNKSQWIQKRDLLVITTDHAQQQILKDQVVDHRVLMNQYSDKVLRYYAFDTTGILVDSILQWYKNVETFESSLLLAKHYFFTSDFNKFDIIWNGIPIQYLLADAKLNVYNRLDSLYKVLRTPISHAHVINSLNTATINVIQSFLTECDEAAFIAKAILRRNGIDASPICALSQARERNVKVVASSQLAIFPNPAKDQVKIIFPSTSEKCTFQITDLLGHAVYSSDIAPNNQLIEISLRQFLAGIYIVSVHSGNLIYSGKLVVENK